MSDYKKIPTSAEVWAVIRARHTDLRVFSSFSDPDGHFNGGPGIIGKMETSYGFFDCDYPIIEARTTWTIGQQSRHDRQNEKTEYWLCLPKKQEE